MSPGQRHNCEAVVRLLSLSILLGKGKVLGGLKESRILGVHRILDFT